MITITKENFSNLISFKGFESTKTALSNLLAPNVKIIIDGTECETEKEIEDSMRNLGY